MRDAAAQGANIILLQELFGQFQSCSRLSENQQAGFPCTCWPAQLWSVACSVLLVLLHCQTLATGRMFNSCFICCRDALLLPRTGFRPL